jgi:flagellar hook protein FlgE
MVLKALNTAVSGLRAEGEAIGVVSDNISNVNTVGFKRQRALFQDVLGHSILAGTSASLPGSGVRVGKIQQLFTQGNLSSTGVSTDLALNGDGFFVVNGTVEGLNSNFYTRAGQFVLDRDGFLVNASGLEVQGYAANGDGTFAASLSSIQAPTAAISPRGTEALEVTANLDSSAVVPLAGAFTTADPANTANFSTTMSVYDSLGNSHTLDIYFSKTASGAWDYNVVVPTADLQTPTSADPIEIIGNGTLTFTTDGALQTFTETTPISVGFLDATGGQLIALDFGPDITGGGTGLEGLTQFAGPSNVSSQSQDGYASGDFSGIAVDGQGVVTGLYSNGEQLAIGQLAVAKFRSNDGLGRAGNNLWIQTRDSGTAAMGTAGSGGRGAVSSGALEASNVDLAEEFVGLITHQRSFSANSRTISTADDMLQELINIKR